MTREERGHHRPESLLEQTKRLLRHYRLHTKKSLGQHFLIERDVLDQIVSAAEIKSSDTVIEVGPGLGVLTRELAQRAGRLIAVELDDNLAEILKQAMAGLPNVTIINRDILETDTASLLKDLGIPPKYKVVANLPYYITALTLRHFLEASVKPEVMVVMVQKEVARQITASRRDMSMLSVSVQYYGHPQIVSIVPARSFFPPPEVDLAILRIDLYPQPVVTVSDTDKFFGLVRAGFSSPRKMLHNALTRRLCRPDEEMKEMLAKAGIEPQRRAETLSLEEWARLWEIYSENKE